MHRNKSVKTDHFAMVPRADIPRSQFNMETAHKTTFDAGYLIPIYVDEMLPGDTFNLRMTAFARMATPIYPIMDNLYLETFFFFVPNRLVWANWQKFMGEQTNPGDSIDYTIPQCTAPVAGWAVGSIGDYFGLPTVGQPTNTTNAWSHSVLPLRCYNLIWNTWFRDENLQNSISPLSMGDGPDNNTVYTLKRRGKRHDYFTSALPFVQKGNPVSFGLTGIVPVVPAGTNVAPTWTTTGGTRQLQQGGSGDANWDGSNFGVNQIPTWNDPKLQVNLASATATTVNNLRNSFQVQKLLEKDARGGTRYTELLRAHFGVSNGDARLQRPEYLGGGSTPVNITQIAQTAPPNTTGTTPLATTSAYATAVAHNQGFTYSATEHGFVIGLCSVRADLTYQQGIRKMWSRKTRYDFYFPVFAMLGEQPIANKEIFFSNVAATDDAVFGYQERWAEYRYHPSRITGLFRSTSAGTLDGWHLAQRFTTLPTLNDTFIQDTPPMSRVLAVGAAANGQQFIFDSIFRIRAARPLPMFSVPGLIDHF